VKPLHTSVVLVVVVTTECQRRRVDKHDSLSVCLYALLRTTCCIQHSVVCVR